MGRRPVDVYGIGNAIADVLTEVPADVFRDLKLEAGSFKLVRDPALQESLLRAVDAQSPKYAAGGSVANAICGVSQLGGRSAFSGRVGIDRAGENFLADFDQLKITRGNVMTIEGPTGTCVVLVTPDGQRTMRTYLGVAKKLAPDDINKDIVRKAEWLYIEGYLLLNHQLGHDSVKRAVELAKMHGTKIALAVGSTEVMKVYPDVFKHVLEQSDLVIANEAEAMAISGADSWESAFKAIRKDLPNVIVTGGPRGALVCFEKQTVHVPAFKCKVVDTTGAGDAFAGGFLYGVTHGVSVGDSTRGACYLASKVIEQLGARLAGGVKEAWAQGIEMQS